MNSGKIRLPTNKTNLGENILPHNHKEQQRSITSSWKTNWHRYTLTSEQKKNLTLNKLFTPIPTTIFEFSSRYLTLTNQDHKDFLRNTRNAVELDFKSVEKQADTRSTSSGRSYETSTTKGTTGIRKSTPAKLN